MRAGSLAFSASPSSAAALGIGREHEIGERRLAAGRLLFHLAETRATGQHDRAALGRDLAGDQAEQRRLADAVAPDEADARGRRQHRARAVEKKPRSKAVGEVGNLQHRRLCRPSARASRRGLPQPRRPQL